MSNFLSTPRRPLILSSRGTRGTGPARATARRVLTYGGDCTLKLYNPLNYDEMVPFRIGLTAYDGDGHYKTITNNVAQTVKTVLAAGADKSVWMAYYDISPANVDVMTFIITAAREVIAGNKKYAWLNNHLPAKWKPIEWDLIDPLFHNTVRAHTKDLNAAIKRGLPANNPKVVWSPPTALTAAGIQNTMVGGSPHPSDAGHKRLAKHFRRPISSEADVPSSRRGHPRPRRLALDSHDACSLPELRHTAVTLRGYRPAAYSRATFRHGQCWLAARWS